MSAAVVKANPKSDEKEPKEAVTICLYYKELKFKEKGLEDAKKFIEERIKEIK